MAAAKRLHGHTQQQEEAGTLHAIAAVSWAAGVS